mgnify:CR=1 FL=1
MFIDAHLHTIRFPGMPRNAAGDNFATPEELIEMMDRTDVDKGILLPDVSPECMVQQSTNEDTFEICSMYPDRFIPFCNVDPRAGTNAPEADLSLHLNFYKERGCRGLGEITANLAFTDPLVRNLLTTPDVNGVTVFDGAGAVLVQAVKPAFAEGRSMAERFAGWYSDLPGVSTFRAPIRPTEIPLGGIDEELAGDTVTS